MWVVVGAEVELKLELYGDHPEKRSKDRKASDLHVTKLGALMPRSPGIFQLDTYPEPVRLVRPVRLFAPSLAPGGPPSAFAKDTPRLSSSAGPGLAEWIEKSPNLKASLNDCALTPDRPPSAFAKDKPRLSSSADHGMTDLVEYFPDLITLLNDRVKCRCRSCKNRDPITHLRKGCLRHTALVQTYSYVAHAICDASGIDTIAGTNTIDDDELAAKSVTRLLTKALQTETLPLQYWFFVACETAAGFSLVQHLKGVAAESTVAEASVLAAQCGGFTLVVDWIDMSRRLTESSLLGISSYDAALQGLPDDIGLVFAEKTAPFDEHRHTTTGGKLADSEAEMHVDQCEARLVTTMFRTEDILYRRMSMIQTSSSLVPVDPAHVAIAQLRSTWLVCEHDKGLEHDTQSRHLINFEQGLNQLDDRRVRYEHEGFPIVTTIMGNLLKTNILVGRCEDGAVVRDVSKCCLACALKASRHLRYGRLPIVTTDAREMHSNVLVRRAI